MNLYWASALIATALGWTGALIAAEVRRFAQPIIRPLAYLSLLFFVAVTIFDIFPESKRSLSWPVFAAAVAGGYGMFWLITKYMCPICPACAMGASEGKTHATDSAGLILLSSVFSLHCLIDGLALVAAGTGNQSLGIRVLAAVAVHKFPEGFALALMLMGASRSPQHALYRACGIQSATLVGALAGSLFVQPAQFWRGVLLAHVGGTFLYIGSNGLLAAFPRKKHVA